MNEISKRIYDIRKRSGLTQEEIAFELQVSRQTISNWETGTAQPTIEKAIALANLFDISMDELIGRKNQEQNKASEIIRNLKGKIVTITLKYDSNDFTEIGETTYKNCEVLEVNPRSIRILTGYKKQKIEKLIFLKNIECIEREIN